MAACLAMAAGCVTEEDSSAAAYEVVIDAPVVVYVIAGQSNAVGGASIDALSPELVSFAEPFPVAYSEELNAPKDFSGAPAQVSTRWLGQVAPRRGTRIGVELSAARRLVERYGADVALIKHATNGSNLFRNWDVGTENSLWYYMTAYVDQQLAELPEGSQVGGLLWIQGNADGNSTTERAEDYVENLGWLIARFRHRYGPVPVVIDHLPTFFEVSHGDAIRHGQSVVAEVLDGVSVVETSDLGPARDSPGAHYRADAFVHLGTRMVDALPAP